VSKSSILHRLDSGLGGAESGHENDHLLRIRGADVLERFDPAHATHADIEEDQIGRALLDDSDTLFAIRRLNDLIRPGGEHARQRVADLRVVIDDKDGGWFRGVRHENWG
jgi:hypothetical protein